MTANATNNTKNKGFLAVAALGYFVLGMIGTSFAIAPGYASPVFPAAGFAVACCGRGLCWPTKLMDKTMKKVNTQASTVPPIIPVCLVGSSFRIALTFSRMFGLIRKKPVRSLTK